MFEIVTLGLDYMHPSDFAYDDTTHDWWLLLHTKTCAVFYDGDDCISAPPNSAILIPPHTPARYSAATSDFCNSFIRFYTDESFVTNAKMPVGRPFLIRSPENLVMLFRMLSTEHYLGSENKNQCILLLMRLIMLKLSESVAKTDMMEIERELNNLRYEIQMKPGYPWTVTEMAKKMHISSGYLQSVYKKQFGISCMQDVLQKRINLAKDYLVSTKYQIQQISSLCGYQSSEHFCRQFKDIVGISPSAYRDSYTESR